MLELLKKILRWLFKILENKTAETKNKTNENITYYKKENILSPAEVNFSKHLLRAIPAGTYIIPKIRLIDVIESNWKGTPKLIQKHIDFLICKGNSPIMAIELDDKSHEKRKKKDAEKNQIFEAAGLPYKRIKAAAQYNIEDLKSAIQNCPGLCVSEPAL